MTAFADRWGLGPDKYWLRGRLPEEKVAFDEALGVWQVAGYPEVLEVRNDSESFSADSTRLFDVDEEQARLIKGDMAQMNGPEAHPHAPPGGPGLQSQADGGPGGPDQPASATSCWPRLAGNRDRR
ncbi:hypothetical protein SVIOM342S_00493 [Streptomyces violaceorubidus]